MNPLKTRALTRQQIGQFVNSERGIRAFEDVQADIASQYEAITNASFLTITTEPGLGSERVLTPTGDFLVTDGGPNSTYDLALSTTGVVAGAYGDASHTIGITVDSRGRVTSISSYTLNSDNVTEGSTNLYFTNARARSALSNGTGMAYDSATGTIAVGTKLAAYAGGDTPSAFTLSIVDAVDAAAWRVAIGAGTSSTTGTVTSVQASGGTTGLSFSGGPITGSGTLTLSGTLIAPNGGTGQSSYTTGDLLYASSSSALSKLADVATGNALISGGVGVAPSWGKVGLTTHISGTLAVGNGGTGATTLTSGYLVKGNGASAVSASVIYDDGANIGIGNSSPAAKVDVSGNVALSTGGYFYTPYNGATNTGTVRSGIQVDGTSQTLNFYTANSFRGGVDASGNMYLGGGSTTIASGLFYIPAAAGVPTGSPTSISGRVPMYYDSANNDFYIYNSGWKKVHLA